MKKFMGRTMAKMNENRRNGRKALKGFTLVEIIVVLVILAILAAAMIPALTGYIEKANDRTIIAEARNAVTAAQTMASEAYGLGKTVQEKGRTTAKTDPSATAEYSTGYGYDEMEKLAEVPGNITTIELGDKNKIKKLVYVTKDNKKTITYEDGEFGEVTDYSGESTTTT